MKDGMPRTVRLADYRPPAYLVDDVHLTFRLHPKHTLVTSRIRFCPNPEVTDRRFELHGERLNIRWARLDGQDWKPHVADGVLTTNVPNAPFTWETEVEIDPSSNTALEGLYISNGVYCTQCEAEGFRRITFYPDRPDVMATFTVRIESGQPFSLSNGEPVPNDTALPVLLSNGNPTASGDGWAEWHDPWPKPSYLFALVAGDLAKRSDSFRTMDGRDVTLNIWVRPGDEGRASYALDCLKRAMRWDEESYGRIYDLDLFNIVAVDDFNAGAMENKGLNIFNSKYVLASPETATDRDYEFIEGIIAHEYFHNWTGNRVTCRDWFQLCLKEGLTVFRDQQFSGDMRSHAVKRIDDVLTLRTRQFREDNGPLAHPVRPDRYQEINNFYTATVYEKGAEVIGMLKTIVGDEAYCRALNLYFDRHDGEACTVEDWLRVFEDVTGRDLGQFKLWYSQAGTPRVELRVEKQAEGVSDNQPDPAGPSCETWKIIARQRVPPTPGETSKKPLVIPIRLAVFTENGQIGPEKTVVLDTEEAVLDTFAVPSAVTPVISAFRGFSAPVIVEQRLAARDRLVLLAGDTDPFNRWEAGRQLAKEQIIASLDGIEPDTTYLDAVARVAADDTLDPAFRAFALALPSEDDTAQNLFDAGHTADPVAIHAAHEALGNAIARHLAEHLAEIYLTMSASGPYSPDASGAGRRALRLAALKSLVRVEGVSRASVLFEAADNMTDSMGALGALLSIGKGQSQVSAFYDRWRNDANVIDKWFSIQLGHASPQTAVTLAGDLTRHPDFHWRTPNRFRSVIGAFAGNAAGFHDPSGAGYRLVADWLIRLDAVNPQTAARVATAFETWPRYDGDRQGMMRDALTSIRATAGLSRDMAEIVGRILGE